MSELEHAPPEILEVGPLIILPEDHLAQASGQTISLSSREFRLLTELARRRGRIIPRPELFRLVWGRELRPGNRSIDVYVSKLRLKLEVAVPGWRFIHTHFGLGYRLWPERQQEPNVRLQVDNTVARGSAHASTHQP